MLCCLCGYCGAASASVQNHACIVGRNLLKDRKEGRSKNCVVVLGNEDTHIFRRKRNMGMDTRSLGAWDTSHMEQFQNDSEESDPLE